MLGRPRWPHPADPCQVVDDLAYWRYVAGMDEVRKTPAIRELSVHAQYLPGTGEITFRATVSTIELVDGDFDVVTMFRVRYEACRNIPTMTDERFAKIMTEHMDAILGGDASTIPCEHMDDNGIIIEEWNPKLIPSRK